MRYSLFCVLLFVFYSSQAISEVTQPALGLHLEGYQYPYPIKYFTSTVEGKQLQMAYMDVLPQGTSKHQTILLLHGGLAFGAYWKDTIQFLSAQGYRVIVPDQLGFGKSSKENIHYSLHLLAKNSHDLLSYLHIDTVIVIGHSFGGMLGQRLTLMYPQMVSKLILEDSLGLEDYRLSIPYKTVDELVQLHPSWNNIQAMHKALYAHWEKRYEEYARVAFQVTLNPNYAQVAPIQAMIYEMIYTEPTMYELPLIKTPTLFIFGDKDRTAPGKGFASSDIQKKLGNFPSLVASASAKMTNAKVREFINVGHVPHLEVTKKFDNTVLDFIQYKN